MACLQNLLLGFRKKGKQRDKDPPEISVTDRDKTGVRGEKGNQKKRRANKQEERRKREKTESIPLKPKIPSSLEAILGELHPVNSDTADIEIRLRT